MCLIKVFPDIKDSQFSMMVIATFYICIVIKQKPKVLFFWATMAKVGVNLASHIWYRLGAEMSTLSFPGFELSSTVVYPELSTLFHPAACCPILELTNISGVL